MENFCEKFVFLFVAKAFIMQNKRKVDFLRGYAIVNIGRNNSVNRV